jgi:plastocyanin domain-containing protein
MTKRVAILGAIAAGMIAVVIEAAGCKRADHASGATENATVSRESGAKIVKVTVGENGFVPSKITVAKGERVTLELTRVTDDTCAKEVAFPELNLKQELPLNKPVQVPVPTDQARKLTFQCGMGMFKSAVVIESR